MTPVIRLDNVVKKFRTQVALNRVSLEVPAGVVFALLGENGAGKTTAIRILLGLTEADAGRTEVLGWDSRREGRAIRHAVGYVSERPTLYEWMTVAEIGWFAAGFYGGGYLPNYYRLVRDFGLPQKKIKSLSKGMRAKVSLSLALAHDPQLLILDEPTSGLDTLVRREFLESMVDLAADGHTVLLSSHQIPEVERVADMVAIMRKGDLVLVEQLDELKQQMRELTLIVDNEATGIPIFPGEVISERRRGRHCQLLVRGLPEEQLDELRQHPTVHALEVHSPGLEEIFVAYMQQESRESRAESLGSDQWPVETEKTNSTVTDR